MIRPDNPLRPYLEPHSIKEWESRENSRDAEGAGETRGDSGDWLVRLIERKLRGELPRT